MLAQYSSKRGIVSKSPMELYMAFVDMRRFKEMLPADKQQGMIADYDSLHASVQGFTIGVRVSDRQAFSKISLCDDGAPFRFTVDLHFEAMPSPVQTEFWIDLDADLNMMMKMMIGKKLQEALDQVVDGLVAASEGRMPEGFDPNMFK